MKSVARNALYAQAGGATAVLNASAAAVIAEARRHPGRIGKVLAARDGLLGILAEDLVDTSRLSTTDLAGLATMPGAIFGTCRAGLKTRSEDSRSWQRIVDVLAAHQIGYVFYNGGNGSSDTAQKLSEIAARTGYPLCVVGVPKTIDNDMVGTDSCPGFGSAAKYVATGLREAAMEVHSMARTSTKVFVLEVMGRNAGWLTAACGLAAVKAGDAPHLLLFPEVTFNSQRFLAKVKETVISKGFCVIAASEGIRRPDGSHVSESTNRDSHGNPQLGGVAPYLARLVTEKLGHKCHWAVADYLQRAGRHIASATDLAHAEAVGRAAVELALKGGNGIMPVIRRKSSLPYRWNIKTVQLSAIAVRERFLPASFMSADKWGISARGRSYLSPLIEGEALPPFRHGLPAYPNLQFPSVSRRLGGFDIR